MLFRYMPAWIHVVGQGWLKCSMNNIHIVGQGWLKCSMNAIHIVGQGEEKTDQERSFFQQWLAYVHVQCTVDYTIRLLYTAHN